MSSDLGFLLRGKASRPILEVNATNDRGLRQGS